MVPSGPPGRDPLAEIVREVASWEWPVEVLDAEWRLVYATAELRELLGASEEEMGFGEHHLERLLRPAWTRWLAGVDREGVRHEAAATVADGIPLPATVTDAIGAVDERAAVDARSYSFRWHAPYIVGDEREAPPLEIRRASLVLRGSDGQLTGALGIYLPKAPITFIDRAGRGDAGMLRRLTELASPRRRSAGILFADLQRSSALARRLPTHVYFELGRKVVGAVDALVVAEGGVVGQHAGDGVTAFFISDQIGSEAAAARALVAVARAVGGAVAGAVERLARSVSALDTEEVRMRVGVHWGAQLFVGQVATPGRFEVTALGDPVNEAARIEQSAAPGEVLASKEALERIDPADARDLVVKLDALSYTPLASIPGASDKAVEDAGAVAVTRLA